MEQFTQIDECARCGEGDVLGKNIESYDKYTFFSICEKCLAEVADDSWSDPE